MSLSYLHFNIFGSALSDMALSSSSLSERICQVYMAHFYKVNWEADAQIVPLSCREEFLELKKILSDDVKEDIENKKRKLRQEYSRMGGTIKDEQLDILCNVRTVLRNRHWRKSKKTAQLISDIYFDLDREIQNRAVKKAQTVLSD